MKFQKIKIIILFLIFFLLNCNSSNEKTNVKEILIVVEISKNKFKLWESNYPSIKLGDRFFEIKYKAKYGNGKISLLTKYMSDGIVKYSQKQLEADSSILQNIGLLINLKCNLSDNGLLRLNKNKKRLIKLDSLHFIETKGKLYHIYII